MAKKTNFKKEKFAERLLNELNSALRTKFSDSRLKLVSFTKVEVAPDYSHAKVFWDTFDSSTRGDAKDAVESMKAKMRTILAAILKIRAVPALTFVFDSQYEEEQKIDALLKAEQKAGKNF